MHKQKKTTLPSIALRHWIKETEINLFPSIPCLATAVLHSTKNHTQKQNKKKIGRNKMAHADHCRLA